MLLTIPSSVKSFCKCISLQDISIPSSVVDFEESVFEKMCTSLSKKEILSKLNEIPSSTFGGSTAPTKIRSGSFENCTSLNEIRITSSVSSIGSSTFKGCTKLANVTIDFPLKFVGFSAFENCLNILK